MATNLAIFHQKLAIFSLKHLVTLMAVELWQRSYNRVSYHIILFVFQNKKSFLNVDKMAALDDDSLSDASLIEDDDDEGGATKMDTDDEVNIFWTSHIMGIQ